MQSFVTGGTGLLGSNLINRLLTRGHHVKALIRSKEKASAIFNTQGIELIKGNITDPDSYRKALKGCDTVFHCAACYSEYYRNHDEGMMKSINTDASVTMIQESLMAGVRSFVHVSSAGVMEVPRNSDARFNEKTPYAEKTDDPYFRSKIETEKALDRFIAGFKGINLFTVRPTLMMGPGDHSPTPMGNFVMSFLTRKIPVILPGNMIIADARDVAEALINISENGVHGEKYIVGGSIHTIRDVMKALETASGIPSPSKAPPYPVAWLFALAQEIRSSRTGKAPMLTRSNLRRMKTLRLPDSGKYLALARTGFTPLETTIRDTVDFFAKKGRIAV